MPHGRARGRSKTCKKSRSSLLNLFIMKKFSMQIAAGMLAVAGAFASQSPSSQNGSLALQTGYIDTPSPCSIPVQCDNSFGEVCTMLHQGQVRQAYGKLNPSATTCASVLYKRN